MPAVARWQAAQNSSSASAPLGPDQRGDRLGAERSGLQEAIAGASAKRCERRRIAARLRASQRQDERHRQVADPVREVFEEAERQRVRPVRVVDADEERLALAEVRRQPEEAVDQPERRLLVTRDPLERLVVPFRQRPRGAGATGEEPAVDVAVERERLDELGGDPEREVGLELRAPRGQDRHPGGPPGGRGHVEQARLPDPGRALDHDHGADSIARRRERLVDRLTLSSALEQLRFRRRTHERDRTSAAALRRKVT